LGKSSFSFGEADSGQYERGMAFPSILPEEFPKVFVAICPGVPGLVWLASIHRYGYFAEPIKGWSGIDIPLKEERNFDCSGDLRRLRSHDATSKKTD
jgi:hypothetical protein